MVIDGPDLSDREGPAGLVHHILTGLAGAGAGI